MKNPSAVALGSLTSPRKAISSRLNASKGGSANTEAQKAARKANAAKMNARNPKK